MDRRAFLTRLAALGLVVPAAELVQRSYFFGPWSPARPAIAPVPWGDSVRYIEAVPLTRADLEAEKLRFDAEYTRFVAWMKHELMITPDRARELLGLDDRTILVTRDINDHRVWI